MRDSDKFQSDLASWEASAPANPGLQSLGRLRSAFFRCSSGLPESLLADIFADFLDRWGTGSAAERGNATRWLSGSAALLSGDYDSARFERGDWIAIRELVSANADKMPLEELTEIMARVLEARAID